MTCRSRARARCPRCSTARRITTASCSPRPTRRRRSAPRSPRAWKLIYYLNSNLYELYDLKADPWEHDNLAPQHPPAFDTMKAALDGWLERVVFARDPDFNQANEKIKDVLLDRARRAAGPDHRAHARRRQARDHRLSVDPDAGRAWRQVDFHVYFTVKQRTTIAYKFQLAVWRRARLERRRAGERGPQRVTTADGFFPSDRWRVGDHVRERFTVTLPRELPARRARGRRSSAIDPANGPNTIDLGPSSRPMIRPLQRGKLGVRRSRSKIEPMKSPVYDLASVFAAQIHAAEARGGQGLRAGDRASSPTTRTRPSSAASRSSSRSCREQDTTLVGADHHARRRQEPRLVLHPRDRRRGARACSSTATSPARSSSARCGTARTSRPTRTTARTRAA